ncbi:hypothetical protein X726_32710 [Mesorhizobium sp. L103C105A0]|nr:hypothetical protein X726_32710 [Mesorhizobium sp. L103C105A0]
MFWATCAHFLGEIDLTRLFCGTRRLAISMTRTMREFFVKPLLQFERAVVF